MGHPSRLPAVHVRRPRKGTYRFKVIGYREVGDIQVVFGAVQIKGVALQEGSSREVYTPLGIVRTHHTGMPHHVLEPPDGPLPEGEVFMHLSNLHPGPLEVETKHPVMGASR